MIYYFEDARILIGILSFIVYLFAKVQGDKFLFYPERYMRNKFWKHLSVDDQFFKPYSNWLSFLKDGWHLMEFVKGLAIFAAIGVWDLWLGLMFAVLAFVIQKLFMR